MYVFTYFQAVPLLFLRKCRCLAYEHGCHHYQQVGRNITTTNPNIFSIFQFPTFSVIQLPLFFWLARCQFLSTVKNDHILPQVLCNIFVKILRNWYSCKHCNLYVSREASYYCHIVLQNVIKYSEFCFRTAENVRTRVVIYNKKSFHHLTKFFMSTCVPFISYFRLLVFGR